MSSVLEATPPRFTADEVARLAADLLGIDGTVVRALVALITFFTGVVPGLIAYVVLMFVVPRDDAPV